MTDWRFHNPVQVRFGLGVLQEIGAVLTGRRYLVVTHPDPPFKVLLERIAEQAGLPLAVLDGIAPNPSLRLMRQLCAQFQALPQKPQVLVALGGGSVMDATKFLAAGHGQWQPVRDYLHGGVWDGEPAMPFVAIPTTAGTGSEVTRWATIWDPETHSKLSLARDDLYAQTALVDPLLTASLPWPASLASGLDALSHAMESLWNRNANPVTRGLAVPAARDIMAGLERLARDITDQGAREQLASGSLRAGLAFSNTQTALAHSLSYPLTLLKGVPHGIACSFCLPEVMAAGLGIDPQCDAAIAQILGDITDAPGTLRAFLDRLGVAASVSDYGLDDAQWGRIVAEAFDGSRGRNFIGAIGRFPRHTVRPAA